MAYQWRAVGFAIAHPWLCDAMGHLTTRHHLAIMDDASWHLLAALGYRDDLAVSEQWGFADVRQEIDYRAEVPPGSLITVTGTVSEVHKSSLSLAYRLINRSTGLVCSEMVARTVCLDFSAHRARPLPDTIREAALKEIETNAEGENP